MVCGIKVWPQREYIEEQRKPCSMQPRIQRGVAQQRPRLEVFVWRTHATTYMSTCMGGLTFLYWSCSSKIGIHTTIAFSIVSYSFQTRLLTRIASSVMKNTKSDEEQGKSQKMKKGGKIFLQKCSQLIGVRSLHQSTQQRLLPAAALEAALLRCQRRRRRRRRRRAASGLNAQYTQGAFPVDLLD